MEIRVYKNNNDLFADLSNYFIQQIQKNKNLVLGLATGSTPLPLYARLIDAYNNNIISFKDITTINLDEYVGLDGSNFQSYRFFMNDNLFNHIDINKANTFVPDGINLNYLEYENIIEKHPIDIQLLGLGSNGHIAFNEPNTSFSSKTHIVDLSQNTIHDNARFFDKLSDVPTQAITMGISSILSAKNIILLAPQENKKEAIQKMLEEDITPTLPASALRLKDSVTLYLTVESFKNVTKALKIIENNEKYTIYQY
jgi:glucosamine-6-phosphate deaminase